MTGKGEDKVYIDSSQDFDDITRGYTSLGEGRDKYLIKFKKSIPSSSLFYELVETGAGRDKIIIKGNTKLSFKTSTLSKIN